MKIAVVGGGISGLACAYLLHEEHQITLFESNHYIGGHSRTIAVRAGEKIHAVDTGFVVFNDRTYPNFVRLLDRLGVASQPSCMSFSLRCEESGMEYNSRSLSRLFVQRRNLLNPRFLRMLGEVLRFNRQGRRLAASANGWGQARLGEFLFAKGYSRDFVERYLVPISASIWSSDPARIEDFPVQFLAGFMHNHGLLNVRNQPQWRVVQGGSWRYVDRLIQPFRDRIRLSSPVTGIRRSADRVEVRSPQQGWESFDHIIIAAHSDQALRMLDDPSNAERAVLGAIGYQPNDTLLHSDTRLLPRNRSAWASWNYHLLPAQRRRNRVAVTYHMNRLQSLDAERQFCVSLNRSQDVAPSQVIERLRYDHPIFSPQAVQAQQDHSLISGINRTHYCGAYWGYGFHEDGLNSALRVCRYFGKSLGKSGEASDSRQRYRASA